jgi:hypothetical protein
MAAAPVADESVAAVEQHQAEQMKVYWKVCLSPVRLGYENMFTVRVP